MGSVWLVVVAAPSIQSRKGGEYRPSSSNGISHQRLVRPRPTIHQPARARRRGPPDRVIRYSTPSGRIATDSTALIAPVRPNTRAATPAQRRGEPRAAPRIRATSIHGASIMGHASTDTVVSSVSTRMLST